MVMDASLLMRQIKGTPHRSKLFAARGRLSIPEFIDNAKDAIRYAITDPLGRPS